MSTTVATETTTNIFDLAKTLQIGEYITMRHVCQHGDYPICDLLKKTHDMVSLNNLLEKGLLKQTHYVGQSRVHPTGDGRRVWEQARVLLGVTLL
jgi:hypothetical protein